MSRVFIDTNVLVYCVDGRSPATRTRARKLLRAVRRDSSGVISTQVLQEFYVAATRKLGVDPRIAHRIVGLLRNLEVVTVTPFLIDRAIGLSVLNQLSFWDALIVVSAEEAGCEEVCSEDFQAGGVVRGVRIANPFEVEHS